MLFTDLVHPANLASALDAKLITIRESDDGQRIYNYSDAAMYTPGAWDNPAVRQCRGLIVDQAGRVVARPWAKFFNHGQKEAGDLDLTAPVEVTDKMDGSLGIIHTDARGKARVATRGSFASDQAIHATKMLRRHYGDLGWPPGVTALVEIIYPANRIVCDYGDLDDLVLLGGVGIDSGIYYGPDDVAALVGWGGPVAETFPYTTLADALAAPPRPGAEGLCVRYLDEPRIVKIKQDDYVALHRIVTGLSERTVWQHMLDGKTLGDLLGPLPDELHEWTRDVWGRLVSEANHIEARAEREHERIVADLDPQFERRDYAEQAKRAGDLTPHLFTILDGRDPRPAILKTLKPAGDTRALARSEAIA